MQAVRVRTALPPATLLAALLLAGWTAPAGAEVVRCTDAAGRTSYTDGKCPAGTRQAQRLPEVEVPPAPPPSEDAAPAPASAPVPAPAPAPAPAAAPGDGLVILDSRGTAAPPAAPAPYVDEPYPYPGHAYGPGYRGAPPSRDMRPRLRNCDATGCNDTLGNHYDRRGRIDRYTGPDGKTCRPVGSTTICR
ncbi:DUF4124 domain-containing protein [Xenophilus sp.]|uniref:DUF4124 domain-containing protein n=1 Tax=Xenophilus sp. TaxID=1873499 RepID=UPI0037DC0788